MADETVPETNTGSPAETPEPVIHTMQDDAEGRPAPLIAPPPKTPPSGAPQQTPPPNIPHVESHPAPQPQPATPPPPMRDGTGEAPATPSPGGDTNAQDIGGGEGVPPADDPFAGSVSDDGDGHEQKKRIIMIGGGVLLVLLLIGGGLIAWQQGLFGGDEAPPIADPTPGPDPDPEPDPEPEPEPVLEQTEVLRGFGLTSYAADDAAEAETIFRDLFTQDQSGNDAVTVQITDNDGSAYPLGEALLAAGMRMDSDVLVLLDELYYSLLILHDNEANATRFAFVAVATEDTNAETLLNETLDWEETMPHDSSALLQNLGYTDPVPEDLVFAEFTRDDGHTIHYANISGPSLALDYVIDTSGPYFIFATSRESMNAALESL